MALSITIAALFLAGLTIWEVCRFELPYRSYFSRRRKGRAASRSLDLLKILAGFVLAWLFIAVSLASGPAVRAVSWSLFALAITVEHGYAKVLGHFTNTTDMLAAVHVHPSTRRDAIRGYVYPLMFLPSLLYGILLLLVHAEASLPSVWPLAVWLSGAALFCLMGLFARDEEFPTPGLTAFYRSVFFFITRRAPPPRLAVSLSSHAPGANVLFIVDESIRSDHLGINGYHRQTTPFLEELRAQGKLMTWGDALAGDTLSFPSNNALLTGIYPAGDPRTQTAPTIFQYARALGYQTCYFDAWGPAFWLGTPADLNDIDLHRHSGHYPGVLGHELDNAIAHDIHALLVAGSPPAKFVWVNKHGAHYGYQHCYPSERAIWKPEWRDSDNLNSVDAVRHERLVNAYDNALHYNLNGFFETLLGPLQELLRNTVILYTSDHAETLSDNGENWGHGRGTASERRVPAILISDGRFTAAQTTASHANMFTTLLTMLSVPASEWAYPYEVALLATPRELQEPGSASSREDRQALSTVEAS
jgi:glucan phosphoethanolaminetransferase (alkaline phosphatase superfamily)